MTTTTCPTCASPVQVVSGDEGTNGFGPVYLLFVGVDHYPSGGVEDYIGTFESLDEAQKWAWRHVPFAWDWAQAAMLTPDGLEIVWREGERYREDAP